MTRSNLAWRRDLQATKAQAARAHPHGADRIFATRRVGFFSKVAFRSGRKRRVPISHGPRSGPVSGTTGRVLSLRYRPRHRLLKVKAEEACGSSWHGFATGDGIAGLRVLLTPETKERAGAAARHQRRRRAGDAGGTLVTMARGVQTS